VGGASGTVGFTNTIFEEKGISKEGATCHLGSSG